MPTSLEAMNVVFQTLLDGLMLGVCVRERVSLERAGVSVR